MNKENMRRAIDLLKDPNNPVGFNMSDYFHIADMSSRRSPYYRRLKHSLVKALIDNGNACRTTACVAGHIMLAFGLEDDGVDPYEMARRFLDLTKSEADSLFLGNFSMKMMNDITIEEAIEEMETMLADA